MKQFFPALVAFFALVLTPGRAALTWHWNATPSAYETEIAGSMNSTIASWNAYSNYTYDIGVIYSSGTPTADAGYLGQIRFGGSRNYRVAMHESSHWMGTGTVSAWSPLYRNGRWTGTYAYNLKTAFDGPGERQSGDGAHYWPYGANQDSEGVDAPRMVGLIGAYRRDMALAQGDMTIGIASGTYRLRNRLVVKMLDSLSVTTEGAQMKQAENAEGTGQQWQVTLVAGTAYFSIRNVASGKYLDSLGGANGSPVVQTSLAGASPVDSQLWQIVATDSFFFRIINKATGRLLDNLGQTADGAGLVQSASGLSRSQQWTFVHTLVQTAPALGVISQGRPVTSSSAESGNYDWKGNNGVAGDRWTASTATYPQWWRVDLGSVQPVTKVAVDWFGGAGRTYKYRIETSPDDASWTTVADRTANTQAGATSDTISANARYVRVTVTGATTGFAAFHECRVYNEAVPMRLVSQFRPTTTSSEQAGNLAVNATDVDSTLTRWTANAASYPQWWQVDLGTVQRVNKALIEWFGQGTQSYQYRIEGSTDGIAFTTLVDKTGNTSQDTSTDTFDAQARYVRVVVTGCSAGGNAAFYDAQIYSATGPLPPSAPSDVAATATADRISLAWSAVPGAGTYTIKRATSASGPFSVLATQASTTYGDFTPTPGVAYYYVVSASGTAGESTGSTPVVAAIPAGLRVHLPFDETSGTVAADDSGFGWHGALVNGPLWTGGQRANALDLDGANDHVSLPSGVVATLNDFTIAAWVYPDTLSAWARIFDFGTGTTRYMFLSPNSGGGTLRFAITTAGGGGEQILNASPLTSGVWTHVAVTLSGTTGTLYVNGTAVATNAAMTLRPSSLGVTTQNWIGRSQYADPYFDGKVDDFRILDRALSSSEIAALVAPPLTEQQSWRQTYFGVTTSTGDAADGADPDGDGWTNAHEFIAGTDPTDREDALKITVLEPSGNDMVISFLSALGRTYRLERSETLATGSWTVVLTDEIPAEGIEGTGGLVQLTDTDGALLSRRFYRVVVIDP